MKRTLCARGAKLPAKPGAKQSEARAKRMPPRMLRNPAMLLLLVVALAGCVATSEGFAFSVQADPQRIFSGQEVRVFIDMANRDTKPIDNIAIKLFDKSLLLGEACEKSVARLLPGQGSGLRCIFRAPQLEAPSQSVTLHAKAEFDAALSAVQGIEMLTEEEHRRQSATGALQQKAQSYSHSDRNVEALVEFSEPLPVVIRPGKDYFVYFTIRNIGAGFVSNLRSTSLQIEQPGDVVRCVPFDTLEVTGNEFPRITCLLALPSGVTYLTNYDIIITINYHYELRQSEELLVVR